MRSCGDSAFSFPLILRRTPEAAAFNRRMRKTARPVVWESDGAQSSSLDPIQEVRGAIHACYDSNSARGTGRGG